MASKIKWNDDRVKGAVTAVLLISRERMARGETEQLIELSLGEYRSDPEGYKESKKGWADVRAAGPLTKPSRVARYQALVAATDQLLVKWTQSKRQFNSLLELDNALIAHLGTKDGQGESLG